MTTTDAQQCYESLSLRLVSCAKQTMRARLLPLAFAVLSVTAHAQSDGARLFMEACAACHGGDGRGLTASQLGFETPVPDFADCDFANREPDADWFAIVHEGGPVRGFDRLMPAFGAALADDEIDAVLQQVRSFCLDARWPRGELNLPRALFTEKAYPEDEAVITTTMVTEGNDSISHEFLWEQRFGAVNQIEISVPVTRADLGEPDGWQTGAGDIGVGVKHTLRHSLDKGSILSIGGEIVLATGDEDRGFGKGSTVFEPYIAYGKMLPRDSFLQVQAFAEFPSDSTLDDEVALRVAMGRSWARGGGFGRTYTPILEVLAARDLHGGADIHWDLVPQFQVTLNRRQHVMANLGLRFPVSQRSTRETELVFYLLWDWFDGGVLEGW